MATYVLKQKLVSIGGDAWIEDEHGQHAFEVDGKALRLRRTLELRDPSGSQLYHIAKSLVHIHNTFELKQGGKVVATIQEGLIGILGDKFTVKFKNGDPELKVTGDIIDHDFVIKRGDKIVVEASRKLISLHDAYGVKVADGFDPALALAIVITVEQMELDEAKKAASGSA